MAENSKIQWTTHTFNPWRGCQKVSAGCANCYAESTSKRNPAVLGVWGPNGTRVVASEAQWKLPHKWNREAEAAGERRRVFCASLADVFEDWQGPIADSRGRELFEDGDGWFSPGDDYIAMSDSLTLDHLRQRLFQVIDETPWLDWLLLTKRPENVLRMSSRWWRSLMSVPGNVWIGTSVENQEQADKRIPELLRVPAAVRFLSMEPLLGPVDLMEIEETRDGVKHWWSSMITGAPWGATLNWVIVGGESGPGARPCDLEWIRSIRDQCQEAGVPVFIKQLGANAVTYNPTGSYRQDTPCRLTFRDRKGGDLLEWPQDLRVRELPTTTVMTGG